MVQECSRYGLSERSERVSPSPMYHVCREHCHFEVFRYSQISGKPVFLRQDVLLSASLHCRMSPYFLNHTSGARRAFWGTTSGMHQKQIGVIFCFFFGTAWTFAPLQAKSTVRTSDSYADIPNSFTALLLLSQDLSEDRTGRRPIVSAGCCWVQIVVHDLS
jgi:hypothetical protein